MGEYTALAFKAIVKPEFRQFEDAYLYGDWARQSDPEFKKFGTVSRSGCIPNGRSCYFADFCRFEEMPAIEQAHPNYNKDTGEWEVFCSLKNYDQTIEEFFKFIPYFIEKADIIYTKFNGEAPKYRYALQDGEVKFIKAEEIEDDNDFYYY